VCTEDAPQVRWCVEKTKKVNRLYLFAFWLVLFRVCAKNKKRVLLFLRIFIIFVAPFIYMVSLIIFVYTLDPLLLSNPHINFARSLPLIYM